MKTQASEEAMGFQHSQRKSVGIWTEWPHGARWSNEGMTRLLGFIIQGAAASKEYVFRVVVPASIRSEAEADLGSLNAVAGTDYTIHSPPPGAIAEGDFVALANFANTNVGVDGWLVLYPYFHHALMLDAPVATIFPDAIPITFPVHDPAAWGEDGYHFRWRNQVQELLSGSHRVITFSRHVATEQATPLFGVDPSKIRIVPHAAPDLIDLLPFVSNRQKTKASLSEAAQILRQHAAERGWRYFTNYPFEEIDYIAVSTQDRVTKNLRIVAEAFRFLVRENRVNIKLIMTAPLHFGATWTALPGLIEREQLIPDIVSMTDLPRPVHAAFYHCAKLTVHPSIFEGGLGPFPFYESVSVGTPCLMAAGPHTRELLDDAPELNDYMFDPNDSLGLVKLIKYVVSNPVSAIDKQLGIFEQLVARGWDQVAADYASSAIY
ncbi:hypothetical protein [Ensifer sp. Root954]|uniref:hypothetical protein n=2 Tax=Ensifer TaxID=106591 RepID=UPI0012E355FE|nr:hypothetical protein [Ensifer sp. Root954]